MMSDGSTSDRASNIDLDVGTTDRRAPDTAEDRWRDDLVICQACARGEPGAWDEFFRRHRPFLMHVALGICRDATVAEDLVSQVTVMLLEKNKLAQYSGQGSLQGWLRAVVAHRFLDERRRARRRALDPLTDEQLRQLTASPADNDCRRHFQPRLLAECAGHLYRNLQHLPSAQAGFMNLYYFQRLTLAEAASALGVHESTASRWNARITRRLQRDLVRFMRRQFGWSPADVYDFLEKCLEFISEQLEILRRRADGAEKLQDSQGGTSI
jgi:RNA polymerase sigma-70 factor (ECF subfamily)